MHVTRNENIIVPVQLLYLL